MLAIFALSLPVAASPCEGVWSILEYVSSNKRRASLKPYNSMTQVFININVKLEEISLDDVTKRGSTAGRNAQRNFTFSKLEIARMCTLLLTVPKPSERF
jgi:hypothetical protein